MENDVIEVDNQFYIRANSSLADGRTRSLLHKDIYPATGYTGNLPELSLDLFPIKCAKACIRVALGSRCSITVVFIVNLFEAGNKGCPSITVPSSRLRRRCDATRISAFSIATEM
jgi:hypothetical protein